MPGLGKFTQNARFRWYESGAVYVPVLGRDGRFIVDYDYIDDDGKADYHTAISNFVGLTGAALRDADAPLMLYYKDHEACFVERGKAPIRSAEELWAHVTLGPAPVIGRRRRGDRAIYISVECECAWEEEHGLELVFKNGLRINKLGSYDGHMTNSDAYGDPRLEDVIYRSLT